MSHQQPLQTVKEQTARHETYKCHQRATDPVKSQSNTNDITSNNDKHGSNNGNSNSNAEHGNHGGNNDGNNVNANTNSEENSTIYHNIIKKNSDETTWTMNDSNRVQMPKQIPKITMR